MALPDVASATRILDLQADALLLENGDPVVTWADASGNGHTFTQAGGECPIYYRGAGSPHAFLSFDGVDDYLTGGDFLNNPASMTVFLVIRLTDFLDGTYATPISRRYIDGSYIGWTIEAGQSSNTITGNMIFNDQDGVSYFYQSVVAFDQDHDAHFLTFEAVSRQEMHVYLDGSINDYLPDGGFGDGVVTDTSVAQNVLIGKAGGPGGAYFGPMYLTAMMVYSPAPNASDRAAIESWLTAKYFTLLPFYAAEPATVGSLVIDGNSYDVRGVQFDNTTGTGAATLEFYQADPLILMQSIQVEVGAFAYEALPRGLTVGLIDGEVDVTGGNMAIRVIV